MAKPSMTEPGSSCHIHTSLWPERRAAGRNGNLFWDAKKSCGSPLFRQFLGGLLKYSGELGYFFAPTINAYKRYQPGSWAPTKLAWAHDNRTVGFRVVGAESSFRIETDAGRGRESLPSVASHWRRHGIEERLDCGIVTGATHVDSRCACPIRCRLPRVARPQQFARRAFGDDVIDFYACTPPPGNAGLQCGDQLGMGRYFGIWCGSSHRSHRREEADIPRRQDEAKRLCFSLSPHREGWE
jgi:glutamine synthetase